MRKILSVMLWSAVFFFGAGLFGAEGWLEDFDEAKKLAAKDNKPILACFSGSDWCVWCVQLDKNVFSRQEFKDYAQKNVVLLMLDFPQSKPQSEKIKNQNAMLAQKFNVEGFPTVLVLDKTGRLVGEVENPGRLSSDEFVSKLKKIAGAKK